MPFVALAQPTPNPPGQISYQGFLTDANGVPLANTAPQNYTIQFRIWNASSAGVNLWAEQQVVTVDRGYFTVMLGNGTPVSGVFSTNNLSGLFSASDASDRYIGLTVTDLGLSEITPRLRLLGSPYSFLAANANALVNPLNGSTMISGSASGVTVNGSLNVSNLNVAGNTIFTNGNVGIGTATPLSALQVVSSNATLIVGNSTGAINADALDGALKFANFGQSQRPQAGIESHVEAPGNGNNADLRFYTSQDWYSYHTYQERMRIDMYGNVGIGTTTPASKLSVNGNGTFQNSLGVFGASNPGLYLCDNSTYFEMGIATGAGSYSASAGIHDAVLRNQSGNLILQTGTGAAGLVVAANNNNVGIGTATPSSLLQINSSAYGTESLRLSGADYNNHGTDTNGISLILGVNLPGNRQFWIADSAYVARPTTGGVVRITPDQGAIDCIGTDGMTMQPLSLGTGGAMTITSDGSSVNGPAYHTPSDARIKIPIGESDSPKDLDLLKKIKVTDYTYVDKAVMGGGLHKKVIAQELEQVYPQAVSKSVNVIPDIYKSATNQDGWVQLQTDLQVGDRVKLINGNEFAIHEVLEVRDGAFRTDLNPKNTKIFVYGREVKDFRTVDYAAISMLNVSATQELAKRLEIVEAREARIAELEQQIEALKAAVQALAEKK